MQGETIFDFLNPGIRILAVFGRLCDFWWIKGSFRRRDETYDYIFSPFPGEIDGRQLKKGINDIPPDKTLVISFHNGVARFYTLSELLGSEFDRFINFEPKGSEAPAKALLSLIRSVNAETAKTETVKPEPVPAEPVPAEPVSAVPEPVPAEPVPAEPVLAEQLLKHCTIVTFRVHSTPEFIAWIQGQTFNGVLFDWQNYVGSKVLGNTWSNSDRSIPPEPYRCAKHLLDKYVVALVQASAAYHAKGGLQTWGTHVFGDKQFMSMNPLIALIKEEQGFLLEGPEPKLYLPDEVPWASLAAKGIRVIQA